MASTKPYNTHFELDPQDIELIEAALHQKKAELAAAIEAQRHEEVREIRSLLGKIHNQKVWFNPNRKSETYVPLG